MGRTHPRRSVGNPPCPCSRAASGRCVSLRALEATRDDLRKAPLVVTPRHCPERRAEDLQVLLSTRCRQRPIRRYRARRTSMCRGGPARRSRAAFCASFCISAPLNAGSVVLDVSPIAASSQLYQATHVHGPAHAEAVRHQDSRIVRRPYGREEPLKRRSPEIVRHDASDLPNPPSLLRRLPELLDNGGCQQCCNDDQRDGSFGGSLGLIRHAAIVAATTSTRDLYCCRLGEVTLPRRLGGSWRGKLRIKS